MVKICSGNWNILLLVLFEYFVICSSQDFGYDGNEGPNNWGKLYQKCVGKHQSPIDIDLHKVKIVHFPRMKFENFNKRLEGIDLKNNGHTVQISITKGKIPEISGGPLKDKYRFVQMHFHWGCNDTTGSENMIDHKRFPLELHMVFHKVEYGSMEQSLKHADGLTVLSFLYALSDKENHHFRLLEDGLAKIEQFESVLPMVDFVSLDKFTTKNRDVYFTYEGSLTTPPCSEVVTWIEFRRTIPLAHNQLAKFRQISGHDGKLTHNFRPPQPLYDRVIRMNKPHNGYPSQSPNFKIVVSILFLSLFTGS